MKTMAAMTNEGPHLSPSTGKRNRPGSPTRPTSFAVSALVFLLAGWRGGRINRVDPVAVLGAVSAVVVLYGLLREAAMGLAARSRGLSVRHWAWESAFPLSIAIALTLGWFLPRRGFVYPWGRTWRYRSLLPKLGPSALAGASVGGIFADNYRRRSLPP